MNSEMNILSLKRAEDQERKQNSSLHHYTLSPLYMDIFMGNEKTQVSESNLEKPPKAIILLLGSVS